MHFSSKTGLFILCFTLPFGASAHLNSMPIPAIEIETVNQYSETIGVKYEASEVALPNSLYAKLISKKDKFKFTAIPEVQLNQIFDELALDPNARMEDAAGMCASRRAYIQDKLKAQQIISGQLYVSCNFSSGNLKLLDRMTNKYRTYVNYHDVNLFAVQTESGSIDYRVVDVQFADRPVSLSEYLGEVEEYQSLKPKNKKALSRLNRKDCFWEVNSETYSFESALR